VRDSKKHESNYLRSLISQKRLNGLFIVCIEKIMIEHIDLDTIISDFGI